MRSLSTLHRSQWSARLRYSSLEVKISLNDNISRHSKLEIARLGISNLGYFNYDHVHISCRILKVFFLFLPFFFFYIKVKSNYSLLTLSVCNGYLFSTVFKSGEWNLKKVPTVPLRWTICELNTWTKNYSIPATPRWGSCQANGPGSEARSIPDWITNFL